MASQTLRQRFLPAISTSVTHTPKGTTSPSSASLPSTPESPYHVRKRLRKLAMANKGLQYLTIFVAVPLTLATISACISGGGTITFDPDDEELVPPPWVFHGVSMLTSSLMGLSAWLVFTEGAFYHAPELLGLYLAQLFLGLIWSPLVFRLGEMRVAFWVSMALMGMTFLCEQFSGKVNVVAGDLVKPGLAWAAFMAVYNCKAAFGCYSPDYMF